MAAPKKSLEMSLDSLLLRLRHKDNGHWYSLGASHLQRWALRVMLQFPIGLATSTFAGGLINAETARFYRNNSYLSNRCHTI
jgi:hypothetical protein